MSPADSHEEGAAAHPTPSVLEDSKIEAGVPSEGDKVRSSGLRARCSFI